MYIAPNDPDPYSSCIAVIKAVIEEGKALSGTMNDTEHDTLVDLETYLKVREA